MWPGNHLRRELQLRQEQMSRQTVGQPPVTPPEPLVVPGIRGAEADNSGSSLQSFWQVGWRSFLEEGQEHPPLPSPNAFFRQLTLLPPFANGGTWHPEEASPSEGGEDAALSETSFQGTLFSSSESTLRPSSCTSNASDVSASIKDSETEFSDVGEETDDESEDDQYLVLNEEQDTDEALWWPGDDIPDFNQIPVNDIARLRRELRLFPDGKVMLNFASASPFLEFRQRLARFIQARVRETGIRFE